MTPYQRRLLVFLSVATFFEGYDFLALSQILPELRADLGVSRVGAGLLFAFVNSGTVVAYVLVRQADRWGRRPLMMVTILGYTLCTFLTGLSWSVASFALFQFLARIFLIGEWVTSMVYAAEEYPAERRGTVMGALQAVSTVGALFCAGLAPLLLHSRWGWRSVYFVGIVPLLILAFARRGLRETARFEQHGARAPRDLLAVLRGPYRTRILRLAWIWFLTYGCTQTAVSFWKEFVVTDRGWTDADVSHALLLAAVASLPFVFLAGKLLDVAGRRRGAVVIFSVTSLGVFGAYSCEGAWALTASLAAAMFGATAVLPVLNAFTTELVPTEIRADAFAWANNLLGRLGYVASPIVVGWYAEGHGWSAAIRPTALLPLVALGFILLWMPETRRMELEEASRL